MKQILFAGIFFLYSIVSFAQANNSYLFSAINNNVIAYKQGTSCTASAYSFYLINDAGVQAPTPFYTIANTSREVNGIGINPVDHFLYGIEYDRDGSCVFSNFHLMRYDAQGGTDDLGLLPCPVGGTVTSALGCVTNNGNFVYSVKDGSGNSYVSTIAAVVSLSSNPAGTLVNQSSIQIINSATGYSYADWAIHPSNGKIYTYGIANIGGVSTGKVLELDPATGNLQGTGTTDGSSFLDPLRDNFGGVYFGSDGLLYGININTRKLYKIDVTTGLTTYVSTISGSGQIRADMGSFTTGGIVLPVQFTKVELLIKHEQALLHWSVSDAKNIKAFVVESASDNNTFTETKTIATTDKTQTNFIASVSETGTGRYRVKAIEDDGKVVYSSVMQYTAKGTSFITVLANPVVNGQIKLLSHLPTGKYAMSITNASGVNVFQKSIELLQNAEQTISLLSLQNGLYILQVKGQQEVSAKFMAKEYQ